MIYFIHLFSCGITILCAYKNPTPFFLVAMAVCAYTSGIFLGRNLSHILGSAPGGNGGERGE